MAYITLHTNTVVHTDLGREFQYDSDLHLDYIVIGPSRGTFYEVIKKGQMLAKVDWGEMIISGNKSRKRNSTEWVVSQEPEKVISIGEGGTYLVNGEIAATVSSGGELFPYLYKLITQWKWSNFDPYIRIDFDEKKLSSFLALCIVVMELSELHS